MKSFWKKDAFTGLLLAVLFVVAAAMGLLQGLERKAYDWGVKASSRVPSDKIAVIAIDEQSIANLGRWPWPREIHAKMIDILSTGQAKVVGHTAFFFEPQSDAGLPYIHKLGQALANSSLKSDPKYQAELAQFSEVLLDAAKNLDHDQKLSDSLAKANNVLLPMFFELGEPQGKPDKNLPDFVTRNQLPKVNNNVPTVQALGALFPIPALGLKAAGLGHLNSFPDVDGAVRTEPLVVDYYGQYFPSFSLMLAARSLNLGPADIQAHLGESVQLGKQKIATDPSTQMYTYFYKNSDDRPAFTVDSFYDVYTGKIPAAKYRDKIVLIGASAAGVGTLQVTPISPSMSPALTLAHSVSSILKGDYFVAPSWAIWAQIGAFLLVALYLIVLLPRLKAMMAAVVTVILFIALLATHLVLMSSMGLWLQLMLPATMLLVGHLVLTTKRFFSTERGKQKSDADSAESNRMLGLAFQGQGQLDIAFDKFRKVPMDDSLMEVLYNLGLDFERKRQFNKAESVFKYMAEYNPKFRDLPERLTQSKEMAETIILGGAANQGTNSTLKLDKSNVSKPMLGRYQVEKELGKGAMGAVYLGKDPKIGRVVAIKTMALAQEFEEDELADVKERFFREAETAGRLNHPNIVSIYDAGEEHDLAYIAMEFLKGKDLVAYTKPENLLPLPKVMNIVACVAEALDYAHKQHVVHRDIKPANIMYDPESDVPKVTDFGIARVTDASKTKTGMVLGTPSYMSPEQLAGRKIDGSSDLFSLGVTLYQLACGKLPFTGDSLAQLMFRIANEPHTDILSVKPDLPVELVAIINKALAKKVEERFANGTEFANALRACAANLQG